MENNEISAIKSLNNLEEISKNCSLPLETQQAKINEWRNDPKIRYFLYNTYLKNVHFRISAKKRCFFPRARRS